MMEIVYISLVVIASAFFFLVTPNAPYPMLIYEQIASVRSKSNVLFCGIFYPLFKEKNCF